MSGVSGVSGMSGVSGVSGGPLVSAVEPTASIQISVPYPPLPYTHPSMQT
ncbi:unnamed protein product [Anisakis simplex]|uniref:RXRG n=1 Tax=Anisakis simplex TaxID=6269 RepID=A0A0M3JL03_ANISI|nr:unnamed protein product [Anisakis simplex]